MMISGSKADHLRVSQDLRRVAWEESTNANTSPIKCSSSCTDPCVSACGHGAQRIVWRESGEKRSGTHQRPGDTARFGACAGEYAWCYMVLDACRSMHRSMQHAHKHAQAAACTNMPAHATWAMRATTASAAASVESIMLKSEGICNVQVRLTSNKADMPCPSSYCAVAGLALCA